MYGADGIDLDLPRTPGAEEQRGRMEPPKQGTASSRHQASNRSKPGEQNDSIRGRPSHSHKATVRRENNTTSREKHTDGNRNRRNDKESRSCSKSRGLEPPSIEASTCAEDQDSLAARREKLLFSYTNAKRSSETESSKFGPVNRVGEEGSRDKRARMNSESKDSRPSHTKTADHYGLTRADKEDLYGNPMSKGNAYGHENRSKETQPDNAAIRQGRGRTDSQCTKLKGENQLHDIEAAHPINDGGPRIIQNSGLSNKTTEAETSLSAFEQASQSRSYGRFTEDDYSFSDADVSEPNKKDTDSADYYTDQDIPLGSPVEKRSRLQMPTWFSGLAPGRTFLDVRSKITFPDVTNETNIAPRVRGTSSDWGYNEPRVTFMMTDPPKKSLSSRWSALSSRAKLAAGIAWVMLMCTLMAVTISGVKSQGSRGSRSSAVGAIVTELPTDFPSDSPTSQPTLRPTKRPTPPPTVPPTPPPTEAPIAAHVEAIHSKEYDATPRPTRNPTTLRPTHEPSSHPTVAPTPSPTTKTTEDCSDDQGLFFNHIGNPKDCVWLENEKQGITDRKDKNCGTDGNTITDLGTKCRAVCRLYNGCSSSSVLTPSDRMSPEDNCADRSGFYVNHISNPKDCVWLENGNTGPTDRKDKNCGAPGYSLTELGLNCPAACAPYNSCASISLPALTTRMSPEEKCADGEGEYLNHKDSKKYCAWLVNNKTGRTARKDMNCGSDGFTITELGLNCPAACSPYNDNDCSTEIQYASYIPSPRSSQIDEDPEKEQEQDEKEDQQEERTKKQDQEENGISEVNDSNHDEDKDDSPKQTSEQDDAEANANIESDTIEQSTCIDGDGLYLTHHSGHAKACIWLHNGHGPGSASKRREKNCGSQEYPITEIGIHCPMSCHTYSGCDPLE